jgi:NitT/TauT family transport system substrate-binding protein
MQLRQIGIPALLGSFLLLGGMANAAAEVNTVSIAEQYGISYLPLMMMEDNKLLEKEAKAAGLGDITVKWAKFAGGNVMNDALLSGDLQFASGGLGPFITLWAKTRDNIGVKAVAAMNSMPLLLNTRNPAVKTIKDFGPKDKIALPAVKVSIQAITLQMAAEKAFGPDQQNKLDSITVTQSHPDGMAAMLSGSEINSHFTSPPFQYVELAKPGIHTVLNSYEVTGGPHTFNVVWASKKFVDANPKTYAAFLKAFVQVQGNRRVGREDVKRPGHQVHHDAGKFDEVCRVHVPHRHGEGQAGLVEGHVLPERAQPAGKLMHRVPAGKGVAHPAGATSRNEIDRESGHGVGRTATPTATSMKVATQ